MRMCVTIGVMRQSSGYVFHVSSLNSVSSREENQRCDFICGNRYLSLFGTNACNVNGVSSVAVSPTSRP